MHDERKHQYENRVAKCVSSARGQDHQRWQKDDQVVREIERVQQLGNGQYGYRLRPRLAGLHTEDGLLRLQDECIEIPAVPDSLIEERQLRVEERDQRQRIE